MNSLCPASLKVNSTKARASSLRGAPLRTAMASGLMMVSPSGSQKAMVSGLRPTALKAMASSVPAAASSPLLTVRVSVPLSRMKACVLAPRRMSEPVLAS